MIDTILFDLDGTISDLEIRYINPFRELIFEFRPDIHPETVSNIIDKVFGILSKKSKSLAIQAMWTITQELELSLINKVRFLARIRKTFKDSKRTFVLIDNADCTLEYAIQNFNVGIVTSAYHNDLEYAFQQIPLLRDVNVIIDMDSVNHPKPSPEPILKALEILKKKPENAIFIGDLPTDIIAGKNAGVETVAFGGSLFEYTKDLLLAENPNFYVENHDELQHLISELNITTNLQDIQDGVVTNIY